MLSNTSQLIFQAPTSLRFLKSKLFSCVNILSRGYGKLLQPWLHFAMSYMGISWLLSAMTARKQPLGKILESLQLVSFLLCSKYTNPIYDAKQYWTFQICETHLQPMKVNYFNEWHIFPDRVERKSMELPNVKDKMKESPCYLHF